MSDSQLDPYAQTKAASHFCKRALERHGLSLTYLDLIQIRDQISSRNAIFIKWSENENNGVYRSFYRVKIYGQNYIVLYDFVIDFLITIYHNSWMQFKNGEWVAKRKHRKGRRHDKA